MADISDPCAAEKSAQNRHEIVRLVRLVDTY